MVVVYEKLWLLYIMIKLATGYVTLNVILQYYIKCECQYINFRHGDEKLHEVLHTVPELVPNGSVVEPNDKSE